MDWKVLNVLVTLLVVNGLVVRRLWVLLITWLVDNSGIAVGLLGTGGWIDVLHLVVGASRCDSSSSTWGEWVAGGAVPVEVEGSQLLVFILTTIEVIRKVIKSCDGGTTTPSSKDSVVHRYAS